MPRLAVLTAAVAASSAALATTVVVLSRPDLVRRADTVVHGTVDRIEAAREADPRSIRTRVHLRVKTAIKGAPGRDLWLAQAGGTSGPYTLLLPGAASFETGEEVVVLLRCAGGGDCAVLGLAQGKWGVRTDPSGTRKARRTLRGLATPEGRQLGDEPEESLDVLLADLRRLAR